MKIVIVATTKDGSPSSEVATTSTVANAILIGHALALHHLTFVGDGALRPIDSIQAYVCERDAYAYCVGFFSCRDAEHLARNLKAAAALAESNWKEWLNRRAELRRRASQAGTGAEVAA